MWAFCPVVFSWLLQTLWSEEHPAPHLVRRRARRHPRRAALAQPAVAIAAASVAEPAVALAAAIS